MNTVTADQTTPAARTTSAGLFVARNARIALKVPIQEGSPKDQARVLLTDLTEVFDVVTLDEPSAVAFRAEGKLCLLHCHRLAVIVKQDDLESAIGDLQAYFELLYPEVPVTLEIGPARVVMA